MFGRIKAWLASRDGAPVAPDGYRRLAFPGGTVDLPANWLMNDGTGEGRLIARSPDRQIEIVFSVIYFAAGTLEEDIERFAMLASRRVQEEGARSEDAVATRPDVLVQDGDTLVAQYEGRDGGRRQFACKMAMRRGVLAIVHIEASGPDQPWLNDVSGVVFESLALSGS